MRARSGLLAIANPFQDSKIPPDYPGNDPPSQYFSDHKMWFVKNFDSTVMDFVIF